MCISKMFKKEPEKNKALDTLLKIFLVVGIVAGICVILKIVYEKYKQNMCCLCGDDCDCDDFIDECCCDDCCGDDEAEAEDEACGECCCCASEDEAAE